MKKLALTLSALLLIAGANTAWSFGSSSKGTSTAGFLKIGPGARAAAMGEAYSAVANDATALYWNPAALRQVKKNSISLMHADYLESSNYEYGAFAHTGSKFSIGAGVQLMSAGTITGRDDSGLETGGFSPKDMALTLGYAQEIGSFSAGVAAKYIQSKIIDSAETGAVDLGLLSPKLVQEKLSFAFTASNLGGTIKYDQKSESLPVLLKVGSAFDLTKAWLVSADLGFPKDNDAYGAFGTEYRLEIASELSIAGRAGYNTRTSGDVDGFSGASFGAGFNIKSLSFDYGFVPFGDIGDTHRVSLSLNF